MSVLLASSSPCPVGAAPPTTLRIAFLGFNPLGTGYDARGLIDAGADETFSSLDLVGALRFIRRHFPLASDDPTPLDLRITGYSFGGWTALQLAHTLLRVSPRFRLRLGLCDPVRTFRPTRHLRFLKFGPRYATRSANVVEAINYYQTKGLIARHNGVGFRLPFRARWFASQPIEGFENHDVSAEVTEVAGHVEIAEKYSRRVAKEIFR
jgi:hypothetical protein